MPQAIQPGSYVSMYGQQLQKDVLTMAANPTSALAMLTPNNMMTQADAMIGNSMAGIDTMLATVGIGIDPGVAASGIQTSSPLGLANPLNGATSLLGGQSLSPFTGTLGGGSPLGGTSSLLGGQSLSPASTVGGGTMLAVAPQQGLAALMPMLTQMLEMFMGMQNPASGLAVSPLSGTGGSSGQLSPLSQLSAMG